jgi:tetratricopeptide (TPR) repeat protein
MIENYKEIYNDANEMFSDSQYEKALDLYLSILDKLEDNNTLILRIAQCYEELNKTDDSIVFLKTLLDNTLKEENYKEALGVARKILALDPDDTNIIIVIAEIFEKLKRKHDASQYYKIAAQNYQFGGHLDKAVEMLNKVKEIGVDNVKDLIDIVLSEYKRDARYRLNSNIDLIIKELKQTKDYELLNIALNLSLITDPKNHNKAKELAHLYFKIGKLISCIKLCTHVIFLDSKNEIFFLLIKSLWALGYTKIALSIARSIEKEEILIDSTNSSLKAKNLVKKIKKIEDSNSNDLDFGNLGEEFNDYGIDLSYLNKESNNLVDHIEIEKKILLEEIKEGLNENFADKTMIVDKNEKEEKKFKPVTYKRLKQSERYIKEGNYEGASKLLYKALEDEPGNNYIRKLMNRALSLFNKMDDAKYKINDASQINQDTRVIINELEKLINQDDASSLDTIDFSDISFMKNLNQYDKKTLFDLGVDFINLELWKQAVEVFKVLSTMVDQDDKIFFQAKVFYLYSVFKTDKNNEESINDLRELLRKELNKADRLETLYYLAKMHEDIQEDNKAKLYYKQILELVSKYRDVDVRLKMLGD